MFAITTSSHQITFVYLSHGDGLVLEVKQPFVLRLLQCWTSVMPTPAQSPFLHLARTTHCSPDPSSHASSWLLCGGPAEQ